MSNYIITAVEIVKILGLETTDENIIKYTSIVKDQSIAQNTVENWAVNTSEKFINNPVLKDFQKGSP